MTIRQKHPVFIRIACLASFAVATTCAAQEQETTRAERAAKLDAKVSELRSQFESLREKLVDASAQAKSNIRAELDDAGRELSTAFAELEANYDEELKALSLLIEQKWEQAATQTEQFKAETAKDLESARDSWRSSYQELRQAYHEQVVHLQNRMTQLEQDAETTADDLNQEWVSARVAAREQYLATSQQMRQSYEKAILSLETEIDRLQVRASTASAEAAVMLTAMADSLSSDAQVLREELQKSYQETSTKLNRYLVETKAQLETAGDEVRVEIQNEANQLSQEACELQAEMTENSDIYKKALEERVANIRQRAATAKGEAKQKLDQLATNLDAKSKEAAKQVESARQAYIETLNTEIDFAKEQLAKADGNLREAIITRIEEHQSDLERAKQKLKEK